MAATASAALRPKDYKSDLKPVWCPGCGDFAVLAAITKALAFLERLLPPERTLAYVRERRLTGPLPGAFDTPDIQRLAPRQNPFHRRPLVFLTGADTASAATPALATGSATTGSSPRRHDHAQNPTAAPGNAPPTHEL